MMNVGRHRHSVPPPNNRFQTTAGRLFNEGSTVKETELDTNVLPTHLSRVAARVQIVGPDQPGDSFLLTSYLFEAGLKTLAIALWSGLRSGSPENAYAIAYHLVHADGLGIWEDSIQNISSQPLAGYLHAVFQPTLAWLTQKRKPPSDDWFFRAISNVDEIISSLGFVAPSDTKPRTIRHLLQTLVMIRNKTKAHGAVGPDFFEANNSKYHAAISEVVSRCPLFRCRWMHLSVRIGKNTVRGLDLKGPEPRYTPDSDCEEWSPHQPGVHVAVGRGIHPYYVGDLLRTTSECRAFFLPNGGFTQSGQAEFIDYASGQTDSCALSEYSLPPAPLPSSETEGLTDLDVQSNVFGNLPQMPPHYVQRPALQQEIQEKLLDRNHPIITLHGRGGIGKTSLALWVAHELATHSQPPFSCIVWFSARDVDLRPSGPSQVRAAVFDLRSICQAYGKLFGIDQSEASFARVLQSPETDGTGRLLVFDNFETLSDARQVHKFLDTHAHLPNKVLITSRERAFKADWPIEVRGMEYGEAKNLLLLVGRDLGIEGVLSEQVIRSIFEHTDGHPYVMRLVAGEIAKEGCYVPPTMLLPKRFDIVSAVFERSFNKLSQDGKWVYLLVSNWRSAVSELALTVVCAERDVDADAGADECDRLSLITSELGPDSGYFYWAPELARIYGRKKLDSDPDRLAIQEALQDLRRFTIVKPGQAGATSRPGVVQQFLVSALQRTSPQDTKEIDRLDKVLERIADLYPSAWREVAHFRRHFNRDRNEVSYALRRLVEELPFDKSAWVERAEYAKARGDEATYIASLVSAVDADPSDVPLIRDAAFALCQFVDAHKIDIPRIRRGVYLAGVRAHMQKISNELDATGLSRLAWLFLLEDNQGMARLYAEKGLASDPDNQHCRKIVERLKRYGRARRPTTR